MAQQRPPQGKRVNTERDRARTSKQRAIGRGPGWTARR